MRTTSFFTSLLLLLLPFGGPWKKTSGKQYDIYYQKTDREMLSALRPVFASAVDSVEAFFGQPFARKFDIRIHPDRASMDAQWQKAWNMPEFKSECWMVASGTGDQFDLLSPRRWTAQACEHNWADRPAASKLITHEMVHVFHGQHNPSADFSAVEGLDWLVEGLAVLASGQCDAARLAPVREAIRAGKTPTSLDQFWSGPMRYGLSGSVVQYIDLHYGRATLLDLLPMTRKQAVLDRLGVSEEQLLADWRAFYLK